MSPRSKEAFLKLKEDTKSKIEYSAVTLFARQGLSVTVSQIAKHAGISQGLLYQHYTSKEALIYSLVEKATSLSAEYVKAIADKPLAPKERIKQISKMMLDMLLACDSEGTKLFLFMIQFGMNMPKANTAMADMDKASMPVKYLVQIIMQGQAEGSIKQGDAISLALVYWAAVQGLCCFSLTGVPMPSDADLLSSILLK